MSRVTTKNKHQDNHTNTSNSTSDIIAPKPSLTDHKNRSKLDAVVVEVKQDLRGLFGKTGKLIRKLGNAMRKVVKEESICEEIKIALKEEIAEGVISRRTIERHCPDKWKKNTKPKNDNLSFSKQAEDKPRQQVIVTEEGKSVIVNETSSDGINQLQDQSKQNGTDADDNNEADTTAADQGKSVSYNEPKANPESSTSVQELVSHPLDKQIDGLEARTLKQTSMRTADVVMIPKEKYRMVRDAMKKSKKAIFVKYDENRKFVCAEPDEDRNVQIQSDDVDLQKPKINDDSKEVIDDEII